MDTQDFNQMEEVMSEDDEQKEYNQSQTTDQNLLQQQILDLEQSLLHQSQQFLENQLELEKNQNQQYKQQLSQKNKKEMMQQYLEKNLFPILNLLMVDVLKLQPPDFVKYSLNWLITKQYQKAKNLNSNQNTQSSLQSGSTQNSLSNKEMSNKSEINMRFYLTDKVDWILEELVLQVVHSLPKNPVEFAILWLRKKEKEMQIDLKTEIGASGLYIKTMKPIKNYMLTKSIFSEAFKDLSSKKLETENSYGVNHPQYARSLQNLGRLYQEAGKYDKALNYFYEALNLFEKYFGPEYDEVAESLILIGDVMEDGQNYAEAQKVYERALKIKEKIHGNESLQKIQMLLFLGRVVEQQGHFGKAQIHYKKSLFLIQRHYQYDDPMVAKPFEYMGNALLNSGKYQDALGYYKKALKFYKKDENLDFVSQISLLYNMALGLERVNQIDEAVATLRIVYQTACKEIPNHPSIELIEERLAKLESIVNQ